MNFFKKMLRYLLCPHISIMIVLIPVSAVLLIYSMAVLGTQTLLAYCSYFLSAYTLTIWCLKIPKLISSVKRVQHENKYARRWAEDVRLRINISLYGTFFWNTGYGIFQLCLGIYHASFWYYSMATYYILLAIMRFMLVRHTRRHLPGERMHSELVRYRACAWMFFLMNTALSVIIFFMVYYNRTFRHDEITAIAIAAYTFITLTTAIINLIKYQKYNSPVYSASKVISFFASLVSMLTLESTMLTTFGDETMDLVTKQIMLGISGGVISALIIVMSIVMIVRANKALRKIGE